jgi:manganese oxidase
MSFPEVMSAGERRRLTILAFLAVLFVAAIGAIFAVVVFGPGREAEAQTVREYELEIVAADIDYGGGNVWHAWTFNGTVPGPTLEANVGEKLRVTVTNNHDIMHSFHTHLTNYDQEADGSQTNIISGVGTGAMIEPGESYTYEFELTEPGLFYYHCHSASGGHHIAAHVRQGLYGAILVKHPEDPDIRDEVIFMGEIGHDREGPQVPPYIMNGMGLPGGEHALEEIFHEEGFEGVAAELNKTVPAIEAEVGETMRVHVINIGDVIHTFHAHNVSHISLGALQGRVWPANVVPLMPGTADTLQFTFTKPGLWLFHCHVVQHADMGMIGLFIIEEPEGEAQPP